MNKAKAKYRDIHFRSEKNNKVMCVHSAAERAYAKELEEDDLVASYETGVALEPERYAYVNPIDIRKDYFKTEWASDTFWCAFQTDALGSGRLFPWSSWENVRKWKNWRF